MKRTKSKVAPSHIKICVIYQKVVLPPVVVHCSVLVVSPRNNGGMGLRTMCGVHRDIQNLDLVHNAIA